MNRILILAVTAAALLTGCSSTEIEGRNFVSVIGYDKSDYDGYDVSVGFIVPDGENMYTAQSKKISSTAADITDKVKSSDKRQLYFGHLKAIIINEDILENPNSLEDILFAASKDSDISMDTIILYCDQKAEEITQAVCDSGDGLYIWDFYKNNKNLLYSTYKLTLAEAIKMLDTQEGIVIPKIAYEDKDIVIEGGIAYSPSYSKSRLDNDEMQGLLYIMELGKKRNEIISFNNEDIVFDIKRNTCDMRFYEEDNMLCADINITVKAQSRENKEYETEEVKNILSGQINRKAEKAVLKLMDCNCDAFGISSKLMRRDERLYAKYSGEDMLEKMRININTVLEIS